MKIYYYLDANNQQQGPFTPQELDQYGVNPQTLVWFEGATDWQPAGEVKDIYDYFMSVTPPDAPSQGSQHTDTQPQNQAQLDRQAHYQKQQKSGKIVRGILAGFFGIVALIPLAGYINSGATGALVFAILLGALVPVCLFVGRNKDPNTNTDGVIEGTVVGMGMASHDMADDFNGGGDIDFD